MKIASYIMLTVVLLKGIGLHAQDLTEITSQQPLKFSGSMQIQGMFYQANGIANRMDPFNYVLSGSPTLAVYGWSIPMSFTLSKSQQSFQQPFNQFGLSPTYKWLTLHGGYRNVSFSNYTLAGHTMLGGGVELTPGKFRFGLMHGKLNRATIIDTTSMSLMPYSFSRTGTAVKLGYGEGNRFFDLSVLKAKDDSTSMPKGLEHLEVQMAPASNVVVGYAGKFGFLRSFFVESDGAVSIYTKDINYPYGIDSLDDASLRRLANFADLNASSTGAIAFSAGIGYSAKQFGIKANYRRIEPNFTSMGAYFFNNDLENYTITPTYNHPQGKIRVNASIGVERDNILSQKEASTRRFIASGNIGSEITSRLGVDLNFNNFSNNQRPNTLRFADSLKIVQTTTMIGLTPRYVIPGEDKTQMFFVSGNLSTMTDYNSYFDNTGTAPSRDIRTVQCLANYNISFPKKRMSFNAGLNYTDLSSELIKNNYMGGSLGGNYAFLQNKLFAGVNASYLVGDSNGNRSTIINGSTNLNYIFNKLHSVRAMVYFTNNNPGSVVIGGNPAFSETRGEISYQLNFGL